MHIVLFELDIINRISFCSDKKLYENLINAVRDELEDLDKYRKELKRPKK